MKIFVFLLIIFVTKINGRETVSYNDRIQNAIDYFRDVCDFEPDEPNLGKVKSCVTNNPQESKTEECVDKVCKASKVRSLINGYREVVCNDQIKEETLKKIKDCVEYYPEELKTKVQTCMGIKTPGTLRQRFYDKHCSVHMQECTEKADIDYILNNWSYFDVAKRIVSCIRKNSGTPKEINSLINSYKEVVCNQDISEGSLEKIKGCFKLYPKGLKDKVQTCLGLKGPGTLRQMFHDLHCDSNVNVCVASALEDYTLEHGMFYQTARQALECVRQFSGTPKEINSIINRYKEVVCNNNISEESLVKIKGCLKVYPEELKFKVQTCLGLKGPGTLRQMYHDLHCDSNVNVCAASAVQDYTLRNGMFYQTMRDAIECVRQFSGTPNEINSIINRYKEVACNNNISEESLVKIKGCLKVYPEELKFKVQTCLGLKGPGTLRQMYHDLHCDPNVNVCAASAVQDYTLRNGMFYQAMRDAIECVRQI